MMKKTHHSTSAVVVTVLLIGGGMFSLRDMDVYGQSEQPTPPSTSLLSNSQASEEWMTSFDLENCNFASTGKNSYFILEPGFQAILEGEEDGERLQLTMTVLDETKEVNGVETRVLEEREET
jgi:hypothetical protein